MCVCSEYSLRGSGVFAGWRGEGFGGCAIGWVGGSGGGPADGVLLGERPSFHEALTLSCFYEDRGEIERSKEKERDGTNEQMRHKIRTISGSRDATHCTQIRDHTQ